MPDKVLCEGCGTPWSPGYINSHRKKCDPYREWSRALPYQCPCGLGFPAERSLRSHKKGCAEAVPTPHLERCVCGGRYPNLTAHRPECPGPPNPDQITLTHAEPPDEQTCVCGFRAGAPLSLPNHTQACPQWWMYRRGLPVKCEGCGAGFRDTYGKRVHAQVCAPWQAWRAARDLEEKQHPCPSCGRLMRGPQLGLHVNSCPGPWTPADWEAWRGRLSRERREEAFAHFAEAGEGVTHLTCGLCGLRFHQLAEHLVKAHGTTASRYRELTGRPTKTEGLKARTRQTLQERHGEGVDHPARVPGHWDRCVAAFRSRYGADHPLRLERFWLKWKETVRRNYDVDHPLRSPVVQERIRRTSQEKYGSDYYFSSDAFKAWSWKTHGAPHPMGSREYVLRLFAKVSVLRPGPNQFEARVHALAPELVFTGNWSWWRWLPALGRHKNPDFVVPGPDPAHPFRGATKTVEAFGSYFHGEKLTGKSRAEHEREIVAGYASAGFQCFVIWEDELARDPTATAARLRAFLARL